MFTYNVFNAFGSLAFVEESEEMRIVNKTIDLSLINSSVDCSRWLKVEYRSDCCRNKGILSSCSVYSGI